MAIIEGSEERVKNVPSDPTSGSDLNRMGLQSRSKISLA
jgi:hypothetical protein